MRSNMTEERWVSVAGYEGLYEVSSLGNVRSVDRIDCRGHRRKGRALRPGSTVDGYRTVVLCRNSHMNPQRVHRLCAIAFMGKPPEGIEVNHINGVKTDNRIENLEFVTKSENLQHAIRTGLKRVRVCEDSPHATLNNMQVRIIRRCEGDLPQSYVAKVFGVSQTHIGRIMRRESFSCLT